MKKLFTLRKTFLTLVLLSIAVCNCFAQQLSRFYKLTGETVIQECDINGNAESFAPISVPGGSKFTIVSVKIEEKTEFYIIRFWAWDTTGSWKMKAKKHNIDNAIKHIKDSLKQKNVIASGEEEKKLNELEQELEKLKLEESSSNYVKASKYNFDFSKPADNLRYFRILKTALDIFATEIVSRWSPTVGGVTLPFKYRYQGGEFKKDLSISSMGGWKRAINTTGTQSLTFLLGIGLSSVGLDSLNTKGKITEAQDRSAVSLSGGIVYQWDRLQIGFFTGYDWLTTPNRDNWSYDGKNWFSIGIGVSLFNEDKAAKNEGKNEE